MESKAVLVTTVLLSVVVCLTAGQGRQVCGDIMVWRNFNATCPERAVCADVFETVRDWGNGTTCPERRVISNCLCEGGTVCPVNNDAHKFHVTRQQSSYTCRPMCNTAWCYNVEDSRRRENNRERVFAMANVQYSPDFNGNIYERMDCRCPRHHQPIGRGRRGVFRAVRSYTRRYDINTHEYTIFFICDTRGDGPVDRSDPCQH